MTTPEFFTVQEVAKRFKVSEMTVYRLVNDGDLTAIRVGRKYLVHATSVEQFIEDNEVRIGSLAKWVAAPPQIRAVS